MGNHTFIFLALQDKETWKILNLINWKSVNTCAIFCGGNILFFTSFQVYHFFHILQTFLHMDNWSDRLSVLWKGPGWIPGKPRLGDPKDIPRVRHLKFNRFFLFIEEKGSCLLLKVDGIIKLYNLAILWWRHVHVAFFSWLLQIEHPVTQYDSKLPRWGNLYVLMHFTLIVIVHGSFQRNRNVRYLLFNRYQWKAY